LYKALKEEGVDACLLVQKMNLKEPGIIGPSKKVEKFINLTRPSLDQIILKFYKNRKDIIFSPSWLGFNNIIKKINMNHPDIVHFHWINAGMIRIEDIIKINVPIIWSLHDMWPFTGGCHCAFGCENYKNSCGNCVVLGSRNENDLSKRVWKRKKRTYQKKEIIVIALSKWIMNCARNSSLFGCNRIIRIPNLIDSKLFKPHDKKFARQLWNLDQQKKLILFCGLGAVRNKLKGFNFLLEALKIIDNKNIELILVGDDSIDSQIDLQNVKFKINWVGRINDDISLVTLYNAADVTVVPSLQENLSNVIMESMSCGVPVVAFHIGGNGDMIDDKYNGYLAKPFDIEDLANGINYVLYNKEYELMSKNAREKIQKEFDKKVVIKKYIELYDRILLEAKTGGKNG
jgi:glycosyltransferase involved in cell wall biosynthesis